MQNFYIYTFYFLFFIFFIFFGAGPSAAHMGWARPSQPGWAQQHACANARVLLHCASELKFTCTV